MQFQFIQATEKDKPYLLTLRQLTMVEHLEKSGQFLSEQEHECRLNDTYHCSYLIIYQQEKIGTLKYQQHDDKVEIMQIQISPQYQGQGLGKQVLLHILNNSKGKTVELTVLKDNPALNLYKRLGFIITGEDEYEFHMQSKP